MSVSILNPKTRRLQLIFIFPINLWIWDFSLCATFMVKNQKWFKDQCARSEVQTLGCSAPPPDLVEALHKNDPLRGLPGQLAR